VGKEENENMWEMLGLFRGFKQRRNWGENYFPVRFIACANGIIKFRATNLKKELIFLDATAAFSAVPTR
jgi:hypothetical protein